MADKNQSGSAVAAPEQAIPRRAWAILAAMGFGALLAQMFSTVIGPALPTIKSDLDLSFSMTTWTITAYSLAFGAALVAGGRLGDLVGEVRMIVIGFIVFGGGLVVSALAAAGPMLVAGRGIQGIGIGISAPATLSIVTNSFPAHRRGFAVGLWGFAHGFGLLIGPLAAGYLTESAFGWRGVFWIAMPITALVIIVTLIATRGYKSVLAPGSYDYLGVIFGASGIFLITLGLQNAGGAGWEDPSAWGPIVAGLVLGGVFAFVEMNVKHPLIDFGLWSRRLFTGGFFAESAVGFIYIPMLTFVGSLYFIGVLDMSPVTASWVIVITTATCMVLEPVAGRWVDKSGPGIPITISLAFQAVALFWMGSFKPETTVTQMIIPLALMGAGVGIALPACNTAGMSAIDKKHAGMASGLMQMTFNIPAALGTALVTSLVGTLAVGRIHKQLDQESFISTAIEYSNAVQAGDSNAASLIENLSQAAQAEIIEATANAQSSAIAMSMVVLGVVATAGAVFAAVVIGRRQIPKEVDELDESVATPTD